MQLIESTLHVVQPLMEAGLDSLGAVELRNALGAKFGIELPASTTLDYPTVSALAAHLAARIAANASRAASSEGGYSTDAASQAALSAYSSTWSSVGPNPADSAAHDVPCACFPCVEVTRRLTAEGANVFRSLALISWWCLHETM